MSGRRFSRAPHPAQARDERPQGAVAGPHYVLAPSVTVRAGETVAFKDVVQARGLISHGRPVDKDAREGVQ